MALNIKDPEADRIAGEIAAMTGESKTRAVRVALAERKARLSRPTSEEKRRRLQEFMEREIWPHIPQSERAAVLTKADREAILGFGPDGV